MSKIEMGKKKKKYVYLQRSAINHQFYQIKTVGRRSSDVWWKSFD